jgi:hypothetical protein
MNEITTRDEGRWATDPYNPRLERWWDGTQWTDYTRWQKPAGPGSAHMLIAILCAIFTLGYMLPWAISASRGMPNAGAVGVLNLLLGWTLVGWVVALVMACAQRQP